MSEDEFYKVLPAGDIIWSHSCQKEKKLIGQKPQLVFVTGQEAGVLPALSCNLS